MTIDPNALWFFIVTGVIAAGGVLLLQRLAKIETTLYRQGLKLVRIETKLGIPDNGDHE